jgi:excisionase family DNA binding protein
MFPKRPEPTIEPMLLKPPEAARTLNVSERTLWQLTKDGKLPAVRINRAVRYDTRDLLKFIDQQKKAS